MSSHAYLIALTNCQNIETLWDMHCQKMAEFGFDRLLYGFTRYRTPTSLGDPEDFVILTNHPSSYTDVFLGESLYFHAPMVNWALEHEGAGSWGFLTQDDPAYKMSGKEQEVYEFNISQGVTAGYSVSFKSVSARSKGAIALTARQGIAQGDVDAVWAEHGQEIALLNNVAHLKILTLPYTAPNRGLTTRQREALEWVGDGKTMQDIAVIMGLTTATIEKHLRLAREALAVETTAQAVLKAAFSNQMFVLDV